ncbi:lysozyme inhibitor LprI family protein [Chitinimonas naiadis]
MRLAAKLSLLTLALLLGSAHAADAGNGFECKPDGNQQEMNACAIRDFQAADKALNNQYQQLMGSLPAASQTRLRTAQRSWLKQRDPRCKTATKASMGGSIWPLEFYGCLQAATEKRTAELAKWPAGK